MAIAEIQLNGPNRGPVSKWSRPRMFSSSSPVGEAPGSDGRRCFRRFPIASFRRIPWPTTGRVKFERSFFHGRRPGVTRRPQRCAETRSASANRCPRELTGIYATAATAVMNPTTAVGLAPPPPGHPLTNVRPRGGPTNSAFQHRRPQPASQRQRRLGSPRRIGTNVSEPKPSASGHRCPPRRPKSTRESHRAFARTHFSLRQLRGNQTPGSSDSSTGIKPFWHAPTSHGLPVALGE